MLKIERLGLATRNRHKFEEIKELLQTAGLHLSLRYAAALDQPEPEETGPSFLENARLKARYYGQFFGCPTLADDSGLVIPALGGFPGIYSSRWGNGVYTQDEKNRILVEIMKVFPPEQRNAYFLCALVLYDPATDRFVWEYEARVDGVISEKPAGHRGFGYDPIFFYPPFQKTFAELPLDMKNEVSHRGQALRAWLAWMKRAEGVQ